MKHLNEAQKVFFDLLKKAPYDIILFHLFSVLIFVANLYLRLDSNKSLKATIIPYTGWGFGNAYTFPIFFIPIILFSSKDNLKNSIRLLRFFIIFNMLVECYRGIEDWLNVSPEDYINPNPYLRYDSLTPIYTIALPLFWIVIVMASLIWSFLKTKKQKQDSYPLES